MTTLLQSLLIAIRALRVNKMRALLTMLGIIIGVMAVISMLSIGQGAQASITSQINAIGTNLLFIRPGNTQQGGVQQQNAAATLTMEDGAALLDPNGDVDMEIRVVLNQGTYITEDRRKAVLWDGDMVAFRGAS